VSGNTDDVPERIRGADGTVYLYYPKAQTMRLLEEEDGSPVYEPVEDEDEEVEEA
jgi:hypothetical protein